MNPVADTYTQNELESIEEGDPELWNDLVNEAPRRFKPMLTSTGMNF